MAKKRKNRAPKETGRENKKSRGVLPQTGTPPEKVFAPGCATWLCAALLPFIALAYYPSYQAFYNDYDIWFHLVYGRHYVENLTWHIDHSIYSWTHAANPAGYVTWLGSSTIYLIHDIFGVPGLFTLHYLVILAAGAIVILFAKAANIRIGLPLLTGLLLTAIVMRIAANFIKPEMFSILFLTLTAAVYLRFRMAPKPWVIAAFPVIFFLWINTHGLWQFGIAFLGIVFGIDVLLYVIRRDQAIPGKALIILSIAAAFTVLALCINPYGASYAIGAVQSRIFQAISIFFAAGGDGNTFFAANIIYGGFSQVLSFFSSIFPFFGGGGSGGEVLDHYRGVRAYISLWEHLFYGQRQPFLTMTAAGMAAMLISFLCAWAVSWKRTGMADLPVVAANITFFFMAMFMGRLALVFALIWITSMVFIAWRAGPEPLFPRAGPLALFTFLGLTAYIAVAVVYIYEDRSWFGMRYQDYIPDKEVLYIMDNDLPGPMFNDYLSGSYLIWTMYPDYKVWIDARHFPYRGRVFTDWQGIGSTYPINPQGLRAFTDKYPVRMAVIHHIYQNHITWFNRSPEWVLAYFDKAAVVMVHRDAIPELPPTAIGAMRPPSHYKDVSNPIILGYLFDVYQKFFGYQYAAEIRDYYEQNVSNRYWNKKNTLSNMDRFLARLRQQEGRR